MVCLKQLITTVPLLVSLAKGAAIISENGVGTTGTLYDEYDVTETTFGATYTAGEPAVILSSDESDSGTVATTAASSASPSASSSGFSESSVSASVNSNSPTYTTLSSFEKKTVTSASVLPNSQTSSTTYLTTILSKSTSTLAPSVNTNSNFNDRVSASLQSKSGSSSESVTGTVSRVSSATTTTSKSTFSDPGKVYISSLVSPSDVTETSIVFTATSSVAPVSSLTGSIISASVATTQTQNPLVTQSFSTSSQSVSINTGSLSKDVTVTTSTPTGSAATSATVVVTAPTVVSTSTYQTVTVSESASTFYSVSSVTPKSSAHYTNETSTASQTSNTQAASTKGSAIPTTTSTTSSGVSLSTTTSVTKSLVTLSLMTTSAVTSTLTSTTVVASAVTTVDLFEPIATNAPPSSLGSMSNDWSFDSNVETNGASDGQTNKFYINLLLDNQEYPAFAYPYILWKLTSTFFGFAVQHTTVNDYTFSQDMDNGNPRVFTNPLNQADLVFSASTFNSENDLSLTVSDLQQGSVLATLQSSSNGGSNYIDIPIVHGMGFSTAIYHGGLIPRLDSAMNIQSVLSESSSNLASGISKYRITINNVDWLVYVTNPSSSVDFEFTTAYGAGTGYSVVGSTAIDGLIIQACVAPSSTDLEYYYDQAAGMYVTSYEMNGTSDGISATYSYDYTTQGASASGNTIIFVLPHQIGVLDSNTANTNTGIEIAALVKGVATGFLTNTIGCIETLNTEISWLPWTSQLGDTKLQYTSSQVQKIASVANSELNVNIKDAIVGLNSYYLGKVLDKYAYILLTVSEIVQDSSVTASTLESMKEAFDAIFQGQQAFPLIYDSKFGGVVSNCDWSSMSSTSDDFGNSHYNDHHFHYGYIIHAAAVVGYVDQQAGGTWAKDNEDFINALIRDVANPSSSDSYFPVSRYFDWFDGHSWASGMYYDINGNDEESTSEDYNFLYAMKMWGTVIGDKSMEYRADLMIKAMSRSLDAYFYFTDENTVQPSEIIPNRVAGITFENFLDYATYFGLNTEYIHGIHMLPITPASSQMRSATFVQQEWESLLASIVDDLSDGWKSILTLNQALYDPKSAYDFFSSSSFSSSYLDNGQSQTWSLAFSAGIANSLGLV